jgi:hypothetical protein
MDRKSYEELEQMVAKGLQRVETGSRWRHYKGNEYVIMGVSIIEATNEVAVVYASVDHPTVSFVRPLSVWLESTDWQGQTVPRFTQVA